MRAIIRLFAAIALMGTLSAAPALAQSSPPPGTLPSSESLVLPERADQCWTQLLRHRVAWPGPGRGEGGEPVGPAVARPATPTEFSACQNIWQPI